MEGAGEPGEFYKTTHFVKVPYQATNANTLALAMAPPPKTLPRLHNWPKLVQWGQLQASCYHAGPVTLRVPSYIAASVCVVQGMPAKAGLAPVQVCGLRTYAAGAHCLLCWCLQEHLPASHLRTLRYT